jgi:hypothetical protein
MLFKNWDFLHIKDIDLHNVVVKKASSLLLMRLKYFYQVTCKRYICRITTALKAKGSSFIINMN